MRRIRTLLISVLLLCGVSACKAAPVEEQFIAMDTVIGFHLEGKEAKTAFAEAQQQIYELEAALSRTRVDSEVSQVNKANGEATEASSLLISLLQAAEQYRQDTDGAFDITIAPVCDLWGFTSEKQQVPNATDLKKTLMLVGGERINLSEKTIELESGQKIDLGGIAKGYVSDLMESLFEKYQITRGTVSLGGNVYVKGTKSDGSLWRVGVQDPKQAETGNLLGIIELQDAYAVTSGGYQRFFQQDGEVYHHIIDPQNGYPANKGLVSVTVVAQAGGRDGEDTLPGSGTMCDALSTALFVMGEEKALDYWRRSENAFELVLVTADDRVLVTDGIEEHFIPSQEGAYTYETVH